MPNKLRKSNRSTQRHGAISVFAAFCLIIVIAFLAFSIDLGYLSVSESQLQNAADSAAISGAKALPDREAAIDASIAWAAKNFAAGENVTVSRDDVEIGFWDEDAATFTVVNSNSSTSPNAVRVTCRRDEESENSLKLFFAPILGTSHANIRVSAVARKKSGSCGGIMANNQMYLGSQGQIPTRVDSYNSLVGSYQDQDPGQQGDVCANGKTTLQNKVYIEGSVKWWNGWSESHNNPYGNNQNEVSGELTGFDDRIQFSPIEVGDAETNNLNDSLPLSDNGWPVLDNDRDFYLGFMERNGNCSSSSTKGKGKGKGSSSDDDDDGYGSNRIQLRSKVMMLTYAVTPRVNSGLLYGNDKSKSKSGSGSKSKSGSGSKSKSGSGSKSKSKSKSKSGSGSKSKSGSGSKSKSKSKSNSSDDDDDGCGDPTPRPDAITLPPGTYYFREMKIENNAVLNIIGPTYIYVEKQFDFRNGVIRNLTNRPINLQIYPMGANAKCYLPRSGEMEAVIYSTVAQIRTHLSTGFDFCGKIVGKKILIKGANLHVDESVSLGDLRGVNSAGGVSGLFLVQ